MFDSFKTMGALAGLMKNREALREAGERVRATLAETVVTGEAGGGAVRVEMTGELRVRSVRLPPGAGAVDEGERAMLERLVVEATNDAMARARATVERVVGEEARELGLPEELGSQFSDLLR